MFVFLIDFTSDSSVGSSPDTEWFRMSPGWSLLLLSLVMCVLSSERKKERKRASERARDLGRILKVAPVQFEITLGAGENTKEVKAGPD